jgi:hypothetical protein
MKRVGLRWGTTCYSLWEMELMILVLTRISKCIYIFIVLGYIGYIGYSMIEV